MITTYKCNHCGKRFERNSNQVFSRNVYCGTTCLHEHQRSVFGSLKDRYQQLRQSILERDNYTCQKCGRSDMPLSVHHKDGKGDSNHWKEANNDPDNLITLCLYCHGVVHYGQQSGEERPEVRQHLSEITDLRQKGVPISEIASRFGVSVARIYQILRRHRTLVTEFQTCNDSDI